MTAPRRPESRTVLAMAYRTSARALRPLAMRLAADGHVA